MTSGAAPPDIDRAWALADTVAARTPAPGREMATRQARVLVAGALARASASRETAHEGRLSPADSSMLADSARAVLAGVEADPALDPARDLLVIEAFVHALLADRAAAVDLLERFLTFNPERRRGFAEHNHWWWRDLRDDPAFQRMIGG